MSAFLELSGLRKVFPDGTEAVRGIDLACGEGEFLVAPRNRQSRTELIQNLHRALFMP